MSAGYHDNRVHEYFPSIAQYPAIAASEVADSIRENLTARRVPPMTAALDYRISKPDRG